MLKSSPTRFYSFVKMDQRKGKRTRHQRGTTKAPAIRALEGEGASSCVARSVLDVVRLVEYDAVPFDLVQDAVLLVQLALPLEAGVHATKRGFEDRDCAVRQQKRCHTMGRRRTGSQDDVILFERLAAGLALRAVPNQDLCRRRPVLVKQRALERTLKHLVCFSNSLRHCMIATVGAMMSV